MNELICETLDSKASNKSFSYTFKSGLIYSLMGLKNSGIDYIFDCLSCPTKTSSVLIDDNNLYKNKPLAERICYIKPNHRFFGLTRISKIMEGCKKTYPKWDNYYCYKLLTFFDIDINCMYYSLKDYQKNLLNAIVAVASRSNITILNEPLMGCDNKIQYDFYNFLYKHHEIYPRTYIISTVFVDDIDYILDEVVFVDKYKAISSFAIEDIKNDFRYLSGKKEVLKSLISGMKVIGYEERNNELTVCLRKKLSKDDIRKYQKYMIRINEVPISKVFIYLINLRLRKETSSI